jgi:hypothetical protein
MILTGCASQRVSTLVGCNYDESKNQTDYLVLPYGSVSIPGKWEKTHYNSVSGQQFFTNSDSVRIAIGFTRFDQYEFNSDGSKKGNDFLQAFYEWESDYFVYTFGLYTQQMETNKISNYILYRLYGSANGGEFDTYFLVGEKNGIVSNFSVTDTDKWTVEARIEFLKGLYLQD